MTGKDKAGKLSPLPESATNADYADWHLERLRGKTLEVDMLLSGNNSWPVTPLYSNCL